MAYWPEINAGGGGYLVAVALGDRALCLRSCHTHEKQEIVGLKATTVSCAYIAWTLRHAPKIFFFRG